MVLFIVHTLIAQFAQLSSNGIIYGFNEVLRIARRIGLFLSQELECARKASDPRTHRLLCGHALSRALMITVCSPRPQTLSHLILFLCKRIFIFANKHANVLCIRQLPFRCRISFAARSSLLNARSFTHSICAKDNLRRNSVYFQNTRRKRSSFNLDNRCCFTWNCSMIGEFVWQHKWNISSRLLDT